MQNIEQPIKKKDGRGGARANSGRKKGSTEQISVVQLLATLRAKSNGKGYDDMLVEDFLKARTMGDNNITIKYHNLILNKVMSTLNRVEVTDTQESIEAKQQAFAEAFANLTGIKKD
jgi:hypothetical protein